MVYTSFVKPSNKIVVYGNPRVSEYNVETATNMYPGRFIQKGTNEDDMIVGDIGNASGILGFEHCNSTDRPATVDTIYVINTDAPAMFGGDYGVVGSLATPHIVAKGDHVANWADGQCMGPVEAGDGGIWLQIPFTNSAASVADTGIDLPVGVEVADIKIQTTTEVAASSIDVGFINAGESGDEDGLVDGSACTAVGTLRPAAVYTVGSNETFAASTTRGILLADFLAGTDVDTDDGVYNEKSYITDGTIKSLTYTTTNHAVVGIIHVLLRYPGFRVRGEVLAAADASSAAVDMMMKVV